MYSNELKDAFLELEIKVDPNNPKETRDEILNRLASLHPDKTGGDFVDSKQRKDFQHLMELLEKFDKETSSSSQMVPLQQVSNLMELLAKQQVLAAANIASNQVLATDKYRRYVKRKYALPKITSAIFASLCIALISLLGNFKNNPLYKVAISYYTAYDQYKVADKLNEDAKDLFKVWDHIIDRAYVFPELRGGAIPIVRREYSGKESSYSEYNNIDLDLFSSTEPVLLKRLGQYTSDLNNKIPALLNKDQSELVKRLRAAWNDDEIRRRWNDKEIPRRLEERGSDSEYLFKALEEIRETKEDAQAEEKAKAYVIKLQNDVTYLANSVKDLESFVAQSKAEVLDRGDKLIVRNLAVVAVLASILFGIIWLRERSDESWIDFLSSDEGLEAALARLYDDKQIMSRVPPRFTLSEFVKAISLKEIPKLLHPLLGTRLNTKQLGQISTVLLDKLETRKIIEKSDTPTIQPWFEIKAKQAELEIDRRN
jgi:hypothetical protein